MRSCASGAFNEPERKQSLIEGHFFLLSSGKHAVMSLEQLLERWDEGPCGMRGRPWVPSAQHSPWWGWGMGLGRGERGINQEGGGFFSNDDMLMFKKEIQSHL